MGETVFPTEEHINWLFSTNVRSENVYKCTTLNRLNRLCVYVYIYTYTTKIEENMAMNQKESKGGHIRWFGERERKE